MVNRRWETLRNRRGENEGRTDGKRTERSGGGNEAWERQRGAGPCALVLSPCLLGAAAERGQLFRGLQMPGVLGKSVTCSPSATTWSSIDTAAITRPLRSCPPPEPPEQRAGPLFTLGAQEAPEDQGRGSTVGGLQSSRTTHSFTIQPFTEPAVSVPHGGCNVIAPKSFQFAVWQPRIQTSGVQGFSW